MVGAVKALQRVAAVLDHSEAVILRSLNEIDSERIIRDELHRVREAIASEMEHEADRIMKRSKNWLKRIWRD